MNAIADLSDAYQKSALRHKKIYREEEVELARLIKSRGLMAPFARDALFLSNLRLVPFIINASFAYRVGSTVSFADLVQEGNIALRGAVEKFDPDRGRFSTFAGKYIWGRIYRVLLESPHCIKIPEYLVVRRININKAKEAGRAYLGREPSTGELCEAMGLDEEAMHKALNVPRNILSLDAPDPHLSALGGKQLTVTETVSDVSTITEDEILDDLALKKLKQSDSVSLYAKNWIRGAGYTSVDTLYLAYTKHCKTFEATVENKENFCKILRSLGFTPVLQYGMILAFKARIGRKSRAVL